MSFFKTKLVKTPLVLLILLSLFFQFYLPIKVEAKVYDFPNFCAPRIPWYDKPAGRSREFYQACYLLKDIYNSAYNQIETAKRIEKYTNPFEEYSPLNKCSSRCYFSLPGIECELDLVDLLCVAYPVLCAKLFNLWQTIQNILTWIRIGQGLADLYKEVEETIEDFNDFTKEIAEAWNDFRLTLAAIGDVNISHLKTFADDFANFAQAQMITIKKINEIEIRFAEIKRQVESNLALSIFGFSSEEIEEIFDEELRTALERISFEDFYQHFSEIKQSSYQLEYLLSPSVLPELSTTTRKELLEKVKTLQAKADQNIPLIDSCLDFPSERLARTLEYLSHLKNPVREILENLNSIETELADFPLPPEITAEIKIEIENEIASIDQATGEVKGTLGTLNSKIEAIEEIVSPLTIEELAQELEIWLNKIIKNIASQIFGYASSEEAFPGISTPQTSIWQDFMIIDTSPFEVFDLASSTKALCCQAEEECQPCCGQANSLLVQAGKARNSLAQVKSLLFNRFEKEGPQEMAKYLRYLFQLKPKIRNFLSQLESLENQVQNFPIPPACPNSGDLETSLNTIQSQINQIKPAVEMIEERIENIELIAGLEISEVENLYSFAGQILQDFELFQEEVEVMKSASQSINASSTQQICWLGEVGSCPACSELFSEVFGFAASFSQTKTLLSQKLADPAINAPELKEFLQFQLQPELSDLIEKLEAIEETIENFQIPPEMTEDCASSTLSNLGVIQRGIEQIKPSLERTIGDISNLEEIAKAEILEVAKLYGIRAKISKIIEKIGEIKDQLRRTVPSPNITKADLSLEYEEIKGLLNELKTFQERKTCTLTTKNPPASISKGAAQAACNRWCWPSSGKITGNFKHKNEVYHQGSFSNCNVWSHDFALFGNPWFTAEGGITCWCQDPEELPQQLAGFGISEAYLNQIKTKIDEAIATIDPLKEAALPVMDVMSALMTIMKLDDLFDALVKIRDLFNKLKSHLATIAGAWNKIWGKEYYDCQSTTFRWQCGSGDDLCICEVTANEDIAGCSGEGCEAVCKVVAYGKTFRRCQELCKKKDCQVVQVGDVTVTKKGGTPGGPGGTGCQFTGQFQDYCKELPPRGVYGERSSQLFIDLDPFHRQISENFGKITSLTHRIGEIKMKLKKRGLAQPAKDIENLVEKKATDIWGKSSFLTVLVGILNSLSKKATCGRSECQSLWCFPALADMVDWDCDWEVCKALGGKTEGNICKIELFGEEIKFWQGKKNKTCEVPCLDAFNIEHTANYLSWFIIWLIYRENGFLNALEEEIK